MSSRQRARLRGNEKRWLEDGENEIEQNSEEEESIDQNFYQIESVISSSSSNSDEEPEENSDRESLSESDHQISRSIKSDIQHFKKRERILENTVDLINVEAPCEDDTFLYTNPHGLDVDYIFSLNLGRHVTGISYGNSRRNKIRQVRRNQVFGLPKEEWPKPLNYINGGIQMVECTSPDWWANQHFPLTVQWYQFQYSSDYSRKQNDFQIIRNSGDINLLILYLSVNPTHIDSLIHLSTLFTQLGQMDRASDLIRRCIYYHEVAYSSSFRPCRNSDHVACCLSWDAHENQSYYHALFLHFQMVWMKGFLTVAVDLLKLILSLNPIVDPKHTLLLLDKFLLMAGRYEEIDHFCRPSSSFVLCLPTLEGEHELLQLQDIFPNWAYTLALSHRLYEEKMKLNVSTAHQLLLKAIRRFPFVLKFYEGVSMPSLERQQWESVQNHPFFKHFMALERLTSRLGRQTVDLFTHLNQCCYKSFVIGSNPQDSHLVSHSWWSLENIRWVLVACTDLMRQMTDINESISQCENYLIFLSSLGGLSHKPLLTRYLNCPLEIFREEFPRIPAEANPINPHLMDPRILEKAYTPPAHTLELLAQYGIGTRNRLNRIPKTIERMMSPGGAIERAIFSGIINLEAFEIELNRLRERGLRESDIEEFRLQLETMNRAIPYRQRGNLHPSLPLLQLFLATLLPWYQIDRSYYNPSSS